MSATLLSEGQATTTTKVRLKQAPLLTKERRQILTTIARSPGITMSEISRKHKHHHSWSDYHLHFLQQAGFVVRRKGARGYSYELYLNGEAP